MSKTEKYRPFDGSDEAFELKIDSNANIEQVCRVLAECHEKDDQERLYYARNGEMKPDELDEDGDAIYTFKNHYSIRTMWPALAQALFYDFPLIVEIQDGEAVTVDELKQAKLIRSEVMRGRDDFLGKFGLSPYEADSLLRALSSDLPFPTLNRIMHPQTPPDGEAPPNTEPPS